QVFIFFLVVLFSSCKKLDVPKNTPACIKSSIKEWEKSGKCNNLVYRYEYKGEVVYLFTDGGVCPDYTSVVYSKNCEVVCSMGGIDGKGDGRCPDFEKQATKLKVIWSR